MGLTWMDRSPVPATNEDFKWPVLGMWASLAYSCWCPHVGQLKVFWLTFVAYAVLHSSRMSYSRIKPVLTSEEWFTSRIMSSMSQEEGLLDSLFLCFYSVGLFASGSSAIASTAATF